MSAEWGGIPEEYRNRIVTGDARVLAERIPDASVDLIFTDPVYERIEDYEWLARTAMRVLKPDSACLVWIANPRVKQVLDAMSDYLGFVMPLNYVKTGGTNLIFSRHVFGWSKMCLWFERGTVSPNVAIPDTILSAAAPAGTHKWNKNPEAILRWLRAFSDVGSVVYDPFGGSGTVPAVCKMTGRNFIASEIDPDTAERARQRVLMTQPPLFVPTEEQGVMELSA